MPCAPVAAARSTSSATVRWSKVGRGVTGKLFNRQFFGCLFLLFVLCRPLRVMAAECIVEKIAALPVTFMGQLPTVPVEINDHVRQMVLDTGAERSVLFPNTVLGLHLFGVTRRKSNVVNAGGNKTTVDYTTIDNFAFANQNTKDLEIGIVNPTVQIGRQKVTEANQNLEIAGILGADILSRYDLDLNFPRRQLGVYYVENCSTVAPPWEHAAISLPVQFTKQKRFALSAEVNGHQLDALFDTGSNRNMVRLSAASSLGVTDEEIQADRRITGSSVGADVFAEHLQKFGQIKIGNETFLNKSLGMLEFSKNDFDMLIGEEYLFFRHFWVSYATSQLFIEQVR